MNTEPSVWAEILWGVVGVGLIVYAITGGADLGAGLHYFFARGPRGDAQLRLLRSAIAPIWEANHVWLIFVIVVLFSAFPRAFGALSVAFHVPLGLGLVGIVFRGAAYAFRAYGIQGSSARDDWDRVFAWASCLTPFFFGLVVGGVSSGAVRVVDGAVTTGFFAGWTTPFALSVGVFSLSLFAMLAAVYLAADARDELADDFRKRALWMEGVTGVLALLTFLLAVMHAPRLASNLARSSFTLPVQAVTAGSALATIALLFTRKYQLARVTAAAQVALVVVGWGLAMRGHFILPDVTVARASAPPEVLPALLLALSLGALSLLPALAYLFWIFKRPRA